MTTIFSATGSQKASSGSAGTTGGSTPFDQITQLEAKEKQRVQKEIAAMALERSEVEKAVDEKTFQAEEELKIKAGEELKSYRETDLSATLMQAKEEATKESSALEDRWNANHQQATDQLIGKMIQEDSPLFR